MQNFYTLIYGNLKQFGVTFLLFIIGLSAQKSYAQCSCSVIDFGYINTSGWTVGQTQTQGAVYAGERVTIANTVAGAVYRISTCGASYDTQLSIYTAACAYVGYNDDNGPACGGLQASIDIVSPGGDLYAVLNQFSCNANSTFTNVNVTLMSLPTPSYRVNWTAQNTGSTAWCAGETRSISVTVQNTGTATWTSSSGNNVNFSWWWNTQGQDTNPRLFPFAGLAPGASQTITFDVTAPSTPGTYTLNYDLVKELDCWFRDNNGSCGTGNVSFGSPVQTVNSTPTAPVSAGVSVCGPATADLTASGSTGSYNWYSDAAGTTLVGTGTTFATPVLSANTNYYVNAISTGTSCAAGNAQLAGASYNSDASWVTPFSTFWHDTRRQYIVTAAELTAAGFCEGNITSLGMTVNSLGSPNLSGLNIRIRNTASATLAGYEAGTTTVWSGNYNPFIGLNNFTFSSPHYWDGTSNLLVEICFDNSTFSSNFGVQMQDVPAGRAFGGYNDGITGSCGYSAWSISIDNNKRPRFNFSGQIGSVAPSCASNLTTVPVTVNTASTAPSTTPIMGTVCPNTNVSLSASGGTAGTGSNIYWYTGPNGTGTLVGTGSPITFVPTTNTTLYARREGACNTTTDASVAVNVKNYIYAANGTTSNNYCTDIAGWNHFFSGDDIIFSIQGNISSAPAGFPQVTIYNNGTYFQETEGPGTAPGCTMNLTPGEERFEMQRSWNVNYGGGAPMGSYNIRFYYPPAERTAIENAANNWISTYPDCSYSYKYATPNGFYWFKNSGSNYVAPQFEDVQYAASIATTPSGINYSQWTGINSFSGGSGAIILIPLDVLPVTLTSFNANCEDNGVRVSWSTASELNADYFDVERSRDGVYWETINTQDAAGTTNQAQEYSFMDTFLGGTTVYYRLRQVDHDGKEELYGPVAASCESNSYAMTVYPNPATNSFTVQVYAESTVNDAQLVIYDFTGKAIVQQAIEVNNGVQTYHFNDAGLARGTYIVRIQDNEGKFTPVKLVIQ